MKALWSRAFRNPGTCRCISCAKNASSSLRKTVPGLTGAIGAQRSWVLNISTSTYPTIDAQTQRDRHDPRNAADPPLDQGNQPLRKEYADNDAHTGGKEYLEESIPEDVDWKTVSRAIGMDLVDDAELQRMQARTNIDDVPEGLWDLLSIDSRFSGPTLLEWPANTGPGLGSRYNLPPQSLWALEQVRLSAVQRKQTRKKIAIQELSVGLLIHNLLAHSGASMLSRIMLASLSPQIGKVAAQIRSQKSVPRYLANIKALTLISVEDWPEDTMDARIDQKLPAEPHYLQDNDGDYHRTAQEMNEAITNVLKEFQKKPTRDVASVMAKICHNLLISSSAPNLQTFNILLTGFKNFQNPQLTDDLINALELCKIRPNEITCAAILDHYAETDRPEPFSFFVARMRGANDALMLANPNININEKGHDRLIRVSETKVLQKVYPTPIVFDALMHGVLRFAGFERAMDIYHEMKGDGWGLDVTGLSRFLDDCIQRADWQGGLLVWEEIASIRGRINPKLLAKAYAQFLALCSVSGNPAAFNAVLKDVTQQGHDQKSILQMAKTFTDAAHRKNTYLAPAFTADNLLIAVSEYMTDGTPEAETANFFERNEEASVPKNTPPQKQNDVKPDDAWEAWMEHELGGVTSKNPKGSTEPR